MAVFSFLFSSTSTAQEPDCGQKQAKNTDSENGNTVSPQTVETEQTSPKPSSRFSSSDASQLSPATPSTSVSSPSTMLTDSEHPNQNVKQDSTRGFSFRSLAFLSNRNEVKPALTTIQEHETKEKATTTFFKSQAKVSGSDKRAKQSALIVRSLIVGTVSVSPVSAGATTPVSKLDLSKVKSQLMEPKSANKVIAQLRALPVSGQSLGIGEKIDVLQGRPAGPIHAVCLDTTDKEAEERHFSQLKNEVGTALGSCNVPSVASASVEKLSKVFKDIHIVSLVKSPDLGLGQPGDGDGILSGALPTAETVIDGFEQITPQLMALGFATSVWPDHKGVYPPTDRMSVLTYWWGLELVLPDSSLRYLSTVESITHTIINFLTAVSVIDNGVREILPFIRYISQFVDFEFSMIQKQNQGKGVVCAATWIMPAAMVPRPWDFAAPPPELAQDTDDKEAPTATSTELSRTSQGTYSTARPSDVTIRNASIFTPMPPLPPILPEMVVNSPNGTA